MHATIHLCHSNTCPFDFPAGQRSMTLSDLPSVQMSGDHATPDHHVIPCHRMGGHVPHPRRGDTGPRPDGVTRQRKNRAEWPRQWDVCSCWASDGWMNALIVVQAVACRGRVVLNCTRRPLGGRMFWQGRAYPAGVPERASRDGSCSGGRGIMGKREANGRPNPRHLPAGGTLF